MKRQRLAASLLRTTVLTGAALACAMPAFAQDDPELADDQIVVTGTRVQNANLTSSSPITQVDEAEFTLSGTTRVEDLLNTYPQLAPSFDSFTVNPTTGFATADLRGLGTQRTLVLVNGHRLPPGGIRSEARDLNQIPAALVKRVEVLTGGASAVYGSDAMAGVVNFILDDEFEGLNIRTGFNGYQHNNNNEYMQGKMDEAGYDYPSGNTGIDGKSYSVDVALGSQFDGGRGHAVGYFTYRQNDELRQGARDYSSCALSASGRACGGSPTAPNPVFFHDAFLVDSNGDPIINYQEDPENPGSFIESGQVINGFTSNLAQDGSWLSGPPTPYNFAPINHYQRPDERWTFGGSVSYDVSPHFQPYMDTMFANTNTSVQIAESGTFFVNRFELDCDSQLNGAFCSQFGDVGEVEYTDANGDEQTVDGFIDTDQPLAVYIGKRNVEGGPRIANLESNTFRVVTGARGEVANGWNYDASFLYARNASSETNENDFIPSIIETNVLNCIGLNADERAADPTCYDVFTPGGVTPESAALLQGTGIRTGATTTMVVNGFLTGDLGVASPMAETPVSVVGGIEWRKETYAVRSDANMATGNFAGLGGPRPSIDGGYSVLEFFTEAAVPVIENAGFLQTLSLDLGYRYSDYNTSGGVHSYKAGATADLGDYIRVRGGYNRAIRAPSVSELFADQQISLWEGTDPCADDVPELSAAECANTGAGPFYGGITPNAANQNNQFSGGNPDLQPETATTWTIGAVVTPLDGLQMSVDYYDIAIQDRIGTIGAGTTLRFCALTGDPFLCNKVNRNPATGDLWRGSSVDTSGFVENLNANFGNLHYRGIDFTGSYAMDALAGRVTSTFTGAYYLEQETEPLPGVNDAATYDCAGAINLSCQQPKWRHTMRVSYAKDWFTGSVRWRYTGGMDYVNTDGSPGAVDLIVVEDYGGKIDAWNYIDLTAGFDVHQNASLTFGVNNVFDKEPPLVGQSGIQLNANAPGGYDQLGRYLFATLDLRF